MQEKEVYLKHNGISRHIHGTAVDVDRQVAIYQAMGEVVVHEETIKRGTIRAYDTFGIRG